MHEFLPGPSVWWPPWRLPRGPRWRRVPKATVGAVVAATAAVGVEVEVTSPVAVVDISAAVALTLVAAATLLLAAHPTRSWVPLLARTSRRVLVGRPRFTVLLITPLRVTTFTVDTQVVGAL